MGVLTPQEITALHAVIDKLPPLSQGQLDRIAAVLGQMRTERLKRERAEAARK